MGPPGQTAHGGQEVDIASRSAGAETADHHQRVELRDGRDERLGVEEVQVGADLDAAGGPDPPAARRGDVHPVPGSAGLEGDARGRVKHLGRPGQVEQLDAVKGCKHHGARNDHGAIVRHHRAGGNDNALTISARRPSAR